MPSVPEVLSPRRKSRQISVGKVLVGGNAPVSVQSMTTTKTTDINGTLQQIAELTASGCEIVRVAVPHQDDADALKIIAMKSQIPVIADIHFQPRYIYTAIDAGCGAVRVNPGNIREFDGNVGKIAAAAKAAGVSLRIGVNAGSLDKRILQKHGKATAEALVESAVWEASLFEEHDFHDFKISVKHNDPIVMVKAYRQLAERGDWPLHRSRLPGHDQVGHGLRHPAFRGDRRHDPRLAVGAAGRRGQGRAPDPAVAEPARAQARDRLVPVVRSRPGGRVLARRFSDRGTEGRHGAAARRRHGLRRERAW
jgi:hypothetical protein